MAKDTSCEMFFVCLCIFFHTVVDYIISQGNDANNKIYPAKSYPHIVIPILFIDCRLPILVIPAQDCHPCESRGRNPGPFN